MDTKSAWIGFGGTVVAALIAGMFALATADGDDGDKGTGGEEPPTTSTTAPPPRTTVTIPPAVPIGGEVVYSGTLNVPDGSGFNFRSGTPKAGSDPTYNMLTYRRGEISDGIVSGARAYGSWGGESVPTYEQCQQAIVENSVSADSGIPATVGRSYCVTILDDFVLYFKILSVDDSAMRVSVTTWRAS